jgi:hypothetical protein
VVTLLEDDRPVLGIVVEVQLGVDEGKRYSWPVYAMAVRAKHRCPACVLVVAPDARVARWARRPIDVGPPEGSAFTPIVVGPDEVPVVTDAELAAQDPELALLSVEVHRRGARAF